MTILVTGATGTVGRHIVNKLIKSGHHVRALTRNPSNAKLPEEVEVVYGDLTEPKTLSSALNGVSGLHLITFNSDGYTPLQTGTDIVELAQKAGVRRVTVLWNGENGPVERAIEDSTLEWTFLQPVEFMSNALGWAESIRLEGIVQEPYGNSPSAMIHVADIADVAVAALIGDGHARQTYTLTGPEVLTVFDKVRILSAAIGKDIQFVELTEDQARDRMREQGSPEDAINFVLGWYANPPISGYTVVPTVEQVTGHPARTFAQWASENVQYFKNP